MTDLISYAHSAGYDPDKRQVCDSIYVPLLRELAAGKSADFLQGLLLRMLAPGLHKQLRRMMVLSFPGIDPDDFTQQWIARCFQIMHSRSIRRKTAYIAASIIERTKRDMVRWATRQYRVSAREETRIIIDEVFGAPRSQLFESEVDFRQLLDTGVSEGVISADDAKLVVAYEIEGMSGEELGERVGLDSKALSHRVVRAIERLQRAFKKSASKSDQPKGLPQ